MEIVKILILNLRSRLEKTRRVVIGSLLRVILTKQHKYTKYEATYEYIND